ncbi:putative fatty acyl-CoA reductase CG5065 [Arctopsyche grandis]|uniref:putative fatty acyl-CoA reductase CG5065 n=1 Tax=Arctopsyche grandis TaxID=121162 RepID=UPI00406D942E
MALQNNQTSQLAPPSTNISVGDFYRGQNIFITGASGFMGRILVEKILWSCADIGNLYILIRSKRGSSAKQRMETLFDSPEYKRVRLRDPNIFKKVIPIVGDISKPNLDISDDDRKLLEDSVSIVFHAASSVRFDDSLKKAILINLRGAKSVVDLVMNMKHLKVMVYFSTTFSNFERGVVEEKVYLSNIKWQDMIKLAETCDENIINPLTEKILDKSLNTYTYTKFLTENLFYEYSKKFPCVIYRPSIVCPIVNEPIPGWTYGSHGPTAIFTGIISGVLHCLHGYGAIVQDLIPCDFAINGILVATWYKCISNMKDCLVINGSNGKAVNIPITSITGTTIKITENNAPNNMLWYPFVFMERNRYMYYFMILFTHVIPAILVDSLQYFSKKKVQLMRLYRKTFHANKLISRILLNEVTFINNNIKQIMSFLNPEDAKTYFYNLNEIDPDKAVYDYIIGIKKFFLKDVMDIDVQKAATRRFKRLYWAHQILKTTFILLAVLIGWNILVKLFFDYTKIHHWL